MLKASLPVPYMAWYIFNKDNDRPLCWDEPCLEFTTEADAIRFLNALWDIPTVADDFSNAEIRQCIYYYDGGKMDASGLIPVANGDDIELRRWDE